MMKFIVLTKIFIIIFVFSSLFYCSSSNKSKSKDQSSKITITKIGKYKSQPKDEEIKFITMKEYNNYKIIGFIDLQGKYIRNLPAYFPFWPFISIDNNQLKFKPQVTLFKGQENKIFQIIRKMGGNAFYIKGSLHTENYLKINIDISKNVKKMRIEVLRKK